MALNVAYEGYEYQDLLSAYFILELILEDVKSTFEIDKKEYILDRFDDLTIRNERGIFKKQIKYSNKEYNHTLKKSDLSTESSYNLAIDELFKSWLSHPDKSSIKIQLCLAWNEPTDDLTDILISIPDNQTFKTHKTNQYIIDIEKLWPSNATPINNWRRLKTESKNINRDDFVQFCENLTIETNFPKSSTDIYEPEQLEKIVLNQVDRLGIGIFPNNSWKKEEFVLSLVALVKKSRSKGTSISTDEIFSKFQIKTDFGSIEQNFPIDNSKNISLVEKTKSFISNLHINKKILLIGEPGSGKSWFIDNLISALNSSKIKTIKHYCYTDIQDKFQKERIKINIFYGNLISDILKIYPHLKEKKKHKYASNLSELNLLLENIDEPTVLIVDGLDHIQRVFNYRPYTDLSIKEIEIINEISKIKCTKYLSIIVASQPIVELNTICGFRECNLPTWTINEVKELMHKLYLDDLELKEQLLSDILLSKSAGNPLYLTYLIEELKNVSKIDNNILSSLPPYSFNMENYYKYLLSKLNLKEQVPLVLSAVNFSLTKAELKEITGLGNFVDESLDLLLPVLKQNHFSNGFIIYHESLRRFILEYLKSKEVIEEKIFLPIINWFEKLDFYSYSKAYRYYLSVLIDGNYFNEAAKYISKEFIKKSVGAGQPWDVIKNNYYYLVKAGAATKDISKIILLNEINKSLSSIEDSYDESFSLYIEAMGYNYGFNRVADFLVFEGKPTLSMLRGLKICYLLDTKKIVAPWNYYIEYFKEGEPIQIEDFYFYIRFFLVNNDTEKPQEIAGKINAEKLFDFEVVFIKELKKFWNQEFIEELIEGNEIIKYICTKAYSKADIEKQDLETLVGEISLFENVFDLEVQKIKTFLKQIERQAEDSETISRVIKKFSTKNWFYNWLIFCIKIIQIKTLNVPDSSTLKSAFDYLGYNTKPFEGVPRTCDLFSLQDFIYESLNGGLALVHGKDEWEYVLKIIEKVSNNTTTSLQKSLGGPLATDKLFEICLENINVDNSPIIIEMLERQYNDKKGYHLHFYISGYCFQLSSAYAQMNNKEKVELFYRLGLDYMLAYTWRRDLTLEDITESIEGINSVDNELGNEYILKIKDLVDSVVEHTDGKDTKHFPVEWFEKFYSINPTNATLYLLNELVGTRYDWRLESSLKYLLNQTNGDINVQTECYLNQTLLIESDELFLTKSLDLLDKLNESPTRKSFLSTINSKIEIKQNSDRSNSFKEKLIKYSNEFDLSKDYALSIKRKSSKNINTIDPIDKLKTECIARKEFSEMSLSELADYFNGRKILDKEVQSLIYVFDGFQSLTPEIKNIIHFLVDNNEHYQDERNVDITPLFESNTEISVYFWVSRFIFQRDVWFKSFSNINAFNIAYKLNQQKSIEFLFELLPNKLNLGFNRVLSANLLNALSKVGYNPSIIKETWLILYEMIESRLPTKDNFDWEDALDNKLNMNLNEVYICLLLSRFKSYTVQKFQIVLSGITNLLNDNSEQLIKPLQWFFSNSELFKKSIQLAILELVCLFNKTSQGFINKFESELKNLYPSNYFLIDYLIEDSYDLPKHFMIQTINELDYPISDKEVEFFISLNNRHRILERADIDMKNIFGKFKATFSRKHQEYIELYGNRIHEWSVNNIYFSDYLLELINTDYYNVFKKYVDTDQVYENLKIDIKTIVAQYLSSSIRPKNLKKFSEYNAIASFSSDIPNDNGWIRLAQFESQLIEQEHDKFNDFKIFGGVTFQNENKSIFPLSGYRLDMDCVWAGIYPNYELDKTIVFSFIQKQFQFEDFKILWLNPIIINRLELQVCDFKLGLCAKNNNNEIVLKFNSWYSDYIASDFSNDISYEIPKLDGSELLIREDYFDKICEMFPVNPKYSVFKTF